MVSNIKNIFKNLIPYNTIRFSFNFIASKELETTWLIKELEQKKRYWVRTCALGGICKEEKVHTDRPSPWGVGRSSHNLGVPVLESCVEEASPLTCWEICWDRQKDWRSLNSTWEECAHAGLPIFRVERAVHWQLLPCHISQSEEGNTPILLTLHHSLVWDLGQLSPGKWLATERQSGVPRV